MAIASAFYTALSGLSVNSSALTVIGNNLANLNTIGFKGSSTTFQDLFSTNLGASPFQGNGNPSQVGLGATVGAVMQNFGQSTFQSTSNPIDMAIQGEGFFYMALVNGGFGHTRSGDFTVDQFGYVVDPSGNRLQGYNRDSRGIIDTTMGSTDLLLPVGTVIPAFATSKVEFTFNLDSTSSPPNDRFTTSVMVYDSLGERHNMLITMEQVFDPVTGNRMENQWRYFVWSPDTEPPSMPPPTDWDYGTNGYANPGGGGATDPPEILGYGTMVFQPNGLLFGISEGNAMGVNPTTFDVTTGNRGPLTTDNPAVGTANSNPLNPTPTLKWRNGASEQPMDWIINTGQATAPNFLVTQVAAASGTTNSKQNGYGAGVMQGLTVDTRGQIIGTFTNGQTYPVGQVAMSIFTNNNGLQKVGQNIWKETVASGPASIGIANDVGRGSILGAHYEMSNVDVADEFTRLIITQRGYQANSRIVTTSDEMMVETLNLKR